MEHPTIDGLLIPEGFNTDEHLDTVLELLRTNGSPRGDCLFTHIDSFLVSCGNIETCKYCALNVQNYEGD